MSLEQVVRATEPTVLIGATGRPGLFRGGLLGSLGDRPLVLPLSNPTEKAECTPEEVRQAIQASALVASGSPFPGTSQCNNVYLFPGVGLGLLSAGVRNVSDGLFLAAAKALSEIAGEEQFSRGLLFPPLRDIRAVSVRIAQAVSREAGASGPVLDLWQPAYLPYRAVPLSASSA